MYLNYPSNVMLWWKKEIKNKKKMGSMSWKNLQKERRSKMRWEKRKKERKGKRREELKWIDDWKSYKKHMVCFNNFCETMIFFPPFLSTTRRSRCGLSPPTNKLYVKDTLFFLFFLFFLWSWQFLIEEYEKCMKLKMKNIGLNF